MNVNGVENLSEGGVMGEVQPHGTHCSSFDAHRPPSAKLISECVHCGFCLPFCPTYQLWGEEMDSPRGRIDLMRHAYEGQIPLDKSFSDHIDACLGCMACMTACPSGVKYDQLIEATRAQIERHVTRSLSDRAFRSLIFWLFPYPKRLRIAAFAGMAYKKIGNSDKLQLSRLATALPARIAVLDELLPHITLRTLWKSRNVVPDEPLATTRPRFKVGLQTGCVSSVFFGDVHQATIKVLDAEQLGVVIPKGQGCCGALSQHAGRGNALDFAKEMITLWSNYDVDYIVTNAAGCGSVLKEYGKLLADDPAWAVPAQEFSAKVRDILELLIEIGPVAKRHPISKRVAYHDACHLVHAQNIKSQPRTLLSDIPGLELLEVPDGQTCCGSAGIYNLLYTDAAIDLGTKKALNIESVKPQIIAAGNPGCLMQIDRFLNDDALLVHPIVLIDASIRNDMSFLSMSDTSTRRVPTRSNATPDIRSKAPIGRARPKSWLN